MSQERPSTYPLNKRSSEEALPLTHNIFIQGGQLLSFPHVKAHLSIGTNEHYHLFNNLGLSPSRMNLSHLLDPIEVFLNLINQMQMLIGILQVIAQLLSQLA